MQFKEFATLLAELETTASRNSITEVLTGFLSKLDTAEVKPCMYLLQGRLAPLYVPLEFNLSTKLALKAISYSLHPSSDQILRSPSSSDPSSEVESRYRKLGDVGLVAEEYRKELKEKCEKKEKGVSILDVFKSLNDIASMSGSGSQDAKVRALGKLLTDLDPLSVRYVCRVVIGNLRLGVSYKTILDTLSVAVSGDKSLRDDLDSAFGARADIGGLAEVVLKTSKENIVGVLKDMQIEAGIPVASKLVEREKNAESVFNRLGEAFVQPKLDGMRAQLHYKDGKFMAFSRNMESLTDMFPDLMDAMKKLKVESIVIDSEVIGFDYEKQKYLPFNDTMQRRRKHDVESLSASIPVRAMAFDILYLNGKDISKKPLAERTEILKEIISSSDQKQIAFLETVIVKSSEELEVYFQKQIRSGLEGVIIKAKTSTYDPGTRNFDWIKLKANTQAEMVDTIDVVVLGYFAGRGVRAKFGIGALLVGLPDDRDNRYYSVAKVGTGMSEEMLQTMFKDLQPLIVKEKPNNVVVERSLAPDVWVAPEIVLEIDADEITRSPSHSAGKDILASFEKKETGKGLSLRFPRLKVWNRDKGPLQATSVQELIRMFEIRKG